MSDKNPPLYDFGQSLLTADVTVCIDSGVFDETSIEAYFTRSCHKSPLCSASLAWPTGLDQSQFAMYQHNTTQYIMLFLLTDKRLITS